MADILLNGEFWLPPEFFSDDDEPEKPQTFHRNPNLKISFDFPTNLGLNGSSLSSSAFSSPVESATETESDEEDESLTGLTCDFTRFGLRADQRSWPLSTSPQSPLPGGENWSRQNPSLAAVRDGGSWNLSYAAVAENMSRIKMKGGDEMVVRSTGNIGPPVGPGPEFPYNHQVEPEKLNHIRNQNKCCSIFGRPYMDDLLDRKIQLQQYILSQHRTRVLSQVQIQENAKVVSTSLGLNSYARPSPLVQHQINQMRGVLFGGFPPKPASAGTGVFIPRPSPSNIAKKPVVVRATAHCSPRMYRAMKSNVNLASTPALITPDHVTTKTMPITKMPCFQLDGSVSHAPILPQEWSY